MSIPGAISASRPAGSQAADHHFPSLAISSHKRCRHFIFRTPKADGMCFLVSKEADVYVRIPSHELNL